MRAFSVQSDTALSTECTTSGSWSEGVSRNNTAAPRKTWGLDPKGATETPRPCTHLKAH